MGRIDIVENRFVEWNQEVSTKHQEVPFYYTHTRAIESITLDKGEAHLKDEIMPKYAEIIYNGLWFSSERIALQKLIDKTQKM